MKRWIDYLIIVFVGIVTHGLLLLNDGIYWDGWLLYLRLVKGDSLSSWLVEAGRPIDFCFHWIMGHFPGYVLEYKWMAFLSIIFSAILIYKICEKTKLVSRGESLLISVITLTYPVFHVGVEMTITAYLFFFMLFFLAAFLTFKSKEAIGITHYVWRVLSLIIFFVSFSLYSLLVYFFGFMLVLILHERHYQGFSWRRIFTFFVPKHLDYLILPFMLWFLNQRFFPLSEFYTLASDKLFKINWVPIKNCFSVFAKHAFYDQWVEAGRELFSHPLLIIVILLMAYWTYKSFRVTISRWLGTEVRPWYFIIIGVVMFVAGVFPYTVVGAYPRMYSWDTRNALLVGLPIALIVVGLFRLVSSSKLKILNHLGFMTLILVITAFILANINAYLFWQSVWIKNRSIIYNLSQKKCAKPISVFWIDQQLKLPVDEAGHFYVWNSMFYTAWGNESHIGFPGRFPVARVNAIDNYRKFLDRGYNFNNAALDPEGTQVILAIRPGPQLQDNFTMVKRYLNCRFFRPGNMGEYLAGVTLLHLEFTPREGPRADGI